MRRKGLTSWQREGHPARARRQPRCQPAQAPGTPEGINPPPPRPVGPGAKSDPGPRAGGDLPAWVGPGRAWQHAIPERLGGARPGSRGGLGGGGQGWSGLAVQGPGAPWDLAATRAPGFWLGAPGQRWSHPFLCPNMGVGEKLRGSLRPQSRPPTLACCHGNQARLPGCYPLQKANGTVPSLPAFAVVCGSHGWNHY